MDIGPAPRDGDGGVTFLEDLVQRAKGRAMRIVLPEGEEDRILLAADEAAVEGMAEPILLGREETIGAACERLGIDMDHLTVIDPSRSPRSSTYCERYQQIRGSPPRVAERIMSRSNYFGAMMVTMGDADGMVGGVRYSTGDIIMAADLLIGPREGVSTPSSFFLMEVPGTTFGEDGMLAFADPAILPEPTPDELADVAVETARSVRALLGWEPRVAMLSFSTKGSAQHPSVDRVITALRKAREKDPKLRIDGELQADTALVREVAKQKMEEVGEVAGRANVLIFPDLNSGNISYKLVQRLAGANAYGPILQGYARPVSDLSRGATVKDIVGAIALVVVQAQEGA